MRLSEQGQREEDQKAKDLAAELRSRGFYADLVRDVNRRLWVMAAPSINIEELEKDQTADEQTPA